MDVVIFTVCDTNIRKGKRVLINKGSINWRDTLLSGTINHNWFCNMKHQKLNNLLIYQWLELTERTEGFGSSWKFFTTSVEMSLKPELTLQAFILSSVVLKCFTWS
ncbi:hypothetical protein INR49_029909 [Caranx melampygus]|nr:hypothetical protein INR49_029909 [Caranx melampygus]